MGPKERKPLSHILCYASEQNHSGWIRAADVVFMQMRWRIANSCIHFDMKLNFRLDTLGFLLFSLGTSTILHRVK